MKNIVLGLLAETFIHPGIGRNEGAIDLPVAREAATDYPYIPGSSLKGALRDHARDHGMQDIETCFGEQACAGDLLVSDARLLLLPVRSLSGSYKWVTSTLALERLRRDCERVGQAICFTTPRAPAEGKVLGEGDGMLYLEERVCSYEGALPDNLVEDLCRLIRHQPVRQRLAEQLVILNDKDFAWYARYALAVQARNVLDEETKESKNLWYEETLPPDTLFYALLASRTDRDGLDSMRRQLRTNPWLQAGGNETVGQGWLATQIMGESENQGGQGDES